MTRNETDICPATVRCADLKYCFTAIAPASAPPVVTLGLRAKHQVNSAAISMKKAPLIHIKDASNGFQFWLLIRRIS
jgi:hypothetical protein